MVTALYQGCQPFVRADSFILTGEQWWVAVEDDAAENDDDDSMFV